MVETRLLWATMDLAMCLFHFNGTHSHAAVPFAATVSMRLSPILMWLSHLHVDYWGQTHRSVPILIIVKLQSTDVGYTGKQTQTLSQANSHVPTSHYRTSKHWSTDSLLLCDDKPVCPNPIISKQSQTYMPQKNRISFPHQKTTKSQQNRWRSIK